MQHLSFFHCVGLARSREMDSQERYSSLGRIAQGSYGTIYKCRDLQDDSDAVMKLIPYGLRNEGVPSSVLREISVLKELNHENVVRLRDVYDSTVGFHLIFEPLDLNLFKFIYQPSRDILPTQVIKSFLCQILEGVCYCHSQKVLHRDLKPENILIDSERMMVKLADFGLSRTFDIPPPQYTTEVVTLSYKAPELLLGTKYSTEVDIWSVGCIFAEMVEKEILFGGTTDTATMSDIIRVCGLPDEEDWPGVTASCVKLYATDELPNFPPPTGLAARVPQLDTQGFDLLSKMLCMNPKRRITAYDALQHPYLKS